MFLSSRKVRQEAKKAMPLEEEYWKQEERKENHARYTELNPT